jgi:hypothetical protein
MPSTLVLWLKTQHSSSFYPGLPFTHVTPWENFKKIIRDGYIKPSLCPVFKYLKKKSRISRMEISLFSRPETSYPGNDRLPIVMIMDPIICDDMLKPMAAFARCDAALKATWSGTCTHID